MSATTYDKPLPVIDADNEGYWANARRHRLSVQRCVDCGDRHFPPGPICPACLSDRQEWQVVSGKGTLVSWVRFHRAYWDGFREQLPYDVCLVQLEEGPLMVSNFHGATPEKLRAGLPMRVSFEDVTAEISLARFMVDER